MSSQKKNESPLIIQDDLNDMTLSRHQLLLGLPLPFFLWPCVSDSLCCIWLRDTPSLCSWTNWPFNAHNTEYLCLPPPSSCSVPLGLISLLSGSIYPKLNPHLTSQNLPFAWDLLLAPLWLLELALYTSGTLCRVLYQFRRTTSSSSSYLIHKNLCPPHLRHSPT